MKKVSYEVVLFKIKNGISNKEAQIKLNSLTNVVASFPGFVNRTLSVSDDGLWMDQVTWSSKEDALFAAENVIQNPKAREVFAIIDDSSMQMFHFNPTEKPN